MAAALCLKGPVLCVHPWPKTAATIPVAARGVAQQWRRSRWWGPGILYRELGPTGRPPAAGSRADDSSAPYEMTVESALKLLGLSESASFDDILRAKNAVLASCKDDVEAAAQVPSSFLRNLRDLLAWVVEAAYDMLLMQRLSQRRAGKVANSGIKYADVKPIRSTVTGAMPEWLQNMAKNIPVSVDSPSANNLGIQAGVYGALMVSTFASGASPTSAGQYIGADVSGLLLATSFGASLYFLSKKRMSLGK
ncbi:hypothetical protein BHM03_00046734 [Ensete ventricosum]|nr:hypothetical protein BHM03_00046734 [Ensete ventricosum]